MKKSVVFNEESSLKEKYEIIPNGKDLKIKSSDEKENGDDLVIEGSVIPEEPLCFANIPPPDIKRVKLEGENGERKEIFGQTDTGSGPSIMSQKQARELESLGIGKILEIKTVYVRGVDGYPIACKAQFVTQIILNNKRIPAYFVIAPLKTLPLFGRRLIEEFRQIDVKDLDEEEFRISDASSYSLFYRKLRKDEFRDNEEQTHVFEIDWDNLMNRTNRLHHGTQVL